jgi:hypothetical protein
MSKHQLQNLHRSFFGKSRKSRSPKRGTGYGRSLNMESLESRQMMSATPIQNMSFSANAGEKPQSKIFQYADQWWNVMPTKQGTFVFRLDGTTWTQTQKISASKSVHADVKMDGDLAYVLLYDGAKTQFATLQYDTLDNRFEAWSQQPNLVNVPLSKGVETATIEEDSTGRLWISSDATTTIEVRYSDGLHTSWSAPITIASGITKDDICSVIAMPNDSIGVMWSNQNAKRFGFRVHVDGTDVSQWSTDEVPAGQSALNIGHGMADDHIHLAMESNGTLYAAVKTSYDKSPNPHISLLVRRPTGVWDNLYLVDMSGTRPVAVVDEAAGQLIIAYTTKEGGGDIVYRTSPLDNISLSARAVLIPGKVNNVTTAKVTSTNEIVFLADSKSVKFTFDPLAPVVTSSFTAAAFNSSSTTSSTNSPTANDLALSDPNLVKNAKFGSLSLGTSAILPVGTTV